MSTKIKWSILIATLGQRQDRFLGLLGVLCPQVEAYKGEIEVLVYWNNFELPLADIRQALVEEAKGEYVSFIDDDDLIPQYYCQKVMDNLGRDYVGWRQQLYNNGVKAKPTFHSLRYKSWSEDDDGWYRDISHLNPIKRSIALKGDFAKSEGAEDVAWADQVRPFVKSENYIDDEMYYYRHSADDSQWRGGEVVAGLKRPKLDCAFCRYHPNSKEES